MRPRATEYRQKTCGVRNPALVQVLDHAICSTSFADRLSVAEMHSWRGILNSMLLRPIVACSLASLVFSFGCDDAAQVVKIVPESSSSVTSTTPPNPIFTTSDTPPGTVDMTPPTADDANAVEQAKLIMRGMNIGNYLDQQGTSTDQTKTHCPSSPPVEGQATGGGKVRGWMFEAIKQAGFDHVRLTVNWNCHTHATDTNPYQIDEAWLARVDWAIASALTRNMAIIIDMHNYSDYFNYLPNEREKFISMWTQLAEHYQNYPKQLFFELLNEPPWNFNDSQLGTDMAAAIAAIRLTNPNRTIIYGGTNYNKAAELTRLTQMPVEDKNLIATIHYYSPYCFTHPGQIWDCPSDHSDPNQSVQWPDMFPAEEKGDAGQVAADMSMQTLDSDLDFAVSVGQQIGRPIYNGEFGASLSRDVTSRAKYISAVARGSEQRNIGWANWGFINCQFDAWNSTVDWYPKIIQALFPDYEPVSN
jgi:endoglucanase